MFDEYILFGCSVKNVSVSLGWGSQKSSIRVVLVEDTNGGQTYTPATLGSPVRITFDGLDFQGIFQAHNKRAADDGRPVFEVTIEDPRDILDGTELIIGSYNGSTLGVPNLLNPYGLAEIEPTTTLSNGFVTGFGASRANESGMPWNIIKSLVELITAGDAGTTYGTFLQYKGYNYTLDLSLLPTVPDYYRIPGSNITLMTAIAQLCADTGCDYFVRLIPGTFGPGTIQIVTQSRAVQPVSGVLAGFINEQTQNGLCKRSGIGEECRNEVTSAFLVGGDATTIYETQDSSTILQYFGDDVNGDPIVSYSVTLAAPSGLTGTDLGVSGSTTRRYRVTAIDMAGETTPSAFFDVVGTIDKPLKSDTFGGQVALSWSAVAGAQAYGIYYQWQGTYRKIATTYTNSFLHNYELDLPSKVELRPSVAGVSPSSPTLTSSYVGTVGAIDRKFCVVPVKDNGDNTITIGNFSNDEFVSNTVSLSIANYIDLSWSDVSASYYMVYEQIPYTGISGGAEDIMVLRGTTKKTSYRFTCDFGLNTPLGAFPNLPSVNTTGLNFANLNSAEIYDIIASYSYTCSFTEMLCAISGIDSWLNFILVQKPVLYSALTCVADNYLISSVAKIVPQDALNLRRTDVINSCVANKEVGDYYTQRVYNFVKKNADEYLGKKFLVEIPSVNTKVEDETGRIVYSAEPASAGYFEGSGNPLGLDNIYTYNFQNGQNMYQTYALYNNVFNGDFSRVDNNDFFIGASGVYVKAGIGEKIIPYLSAPHVVVDINNPMYNQPVDSVGAGNQLLAVLLQGQEKDLQVLNSRLGGGNFVSRVSPSPLFPTRIAIPLKSNILTYGPWYLSCAAGNEAKVQFTYDSSMVPWNYGGFNVLNLTGAAKVDDSVTAQMTSESGEIELVGGPVINLGDVLSYSGNPGPNLTAMDIGYGSDGVTTTYRFNVFTTKFGGVTKQSVERIKNTAIQSQNTKRDIQNSILNIFKPTEIFNKNTAFRAASEQRNRPAQALRLSPHSCLSSITDIDYNAMDSDYRRSAVTTISDNEIKRAVNADNNDEFQKTALMSLNGIVRPFSTEFDGDKLMSTYESPNPNYTEAMTNEFLNPFASGNDIDLYIYGDEYQDAHAYFNNGPENARVFALRGPLVISGWGWSTDDAFVPNASGDLSSDQMSNYLTRSHFWKTGPVDLLWDDERKVWTPHGMFMGVVHSDIPGGGFTNEVDVYENPSTAISGRKKKRTVHNFFSSTVSSGSKIMASWVPEANSWYIVSADCQEE